MAFAGGEELWVFINGQLAVQVFHNPLNDTIPCATINLSPALKGKRCSLFVYLFYGPPTVYNISILKRWS